MKFDGIEIVGLPEGYYPKTVVITNDKELDIKYGLNAVLFCVKVQPLSEGVDDS